MPACIGIDAGLLPAELKVFYHRSGFCRGGFFLGVVLRDRADHFDRVGASWLPFCFTRRGRRNARCRVRVQPVPCLAYWDADAAPDFERR
jgi:hypothetical protein